MNNFLARQPLFSHPRQVKNLVSLPLFTSKHFCLVKQTLTSGGEEQRVRPLAAASFHYFSLSTK